MLKHVPGSKMGKVDSLSRKLDQKIGVEKDNKNETLVKHSQGEKGRKDRNYCGKSKVTSENKVV